ncbi:MAG TPA: twin-arginine translocase TatA/TatE family subunit [Hyphomicrobiales bacterium]|jgi:sec-independent protein translocase protein TatA
MAPTFFKLMVVVLLIVVVFGRGKISDIMGDFAKGIKSFKQGLKDDDDETADRKITDERAREKIEARPAAGENIRAG